MDIEANDLVLFARVADSGSFSRGAARAALPKSTVLEAIADAAAGDAVGVPVCLRAPERVADAYLRASEARKRAGENEAAVALLDKAIEQLPDDRILLYMRLKAAEAAGDIETAASIARRLVDGAEGKAAAPLWMRVFELAAAGGDREAALESLTRSLASDPGCIPARALQIDLLVDGDPQAFASALEAMAVDGMSDAARGRAYLLSANAWAVKASEVAGAKAALTQAAMFGIAPAVISRIARTMAALVGDEAWLEESTRRLLASGAAPAEHVSLWWELARVRMLRGDREGASKALESLSSLEGGAWLGRVLAAYALGMLKTEGEEKRTRSPAELEQLAAVESDPAIARAPQRHGRGAACTWR